MVTTSRLLKRDQASRPVYNTYVRYTLKIYRDYPKVKFVTVECPNELCDFLGTTTFAAFYFYCNGEQRKKLADGEEMSVYMETLEEMFGDETLCVPPPEKNIWEKIIGIF